MSYYRPTFSQTIAMSRGRGYSSSRSSYRGSSSRGSWGSSRGTYSPRGSGGGRFSSSFGGGSFDSRKYAGSSDRYPPRGSDDYRKSYRPDMSSYSNREHRSPDRKRMRTESLSSRHDGGFGGSSEYGGRYESSGYPERRSFSGDRRSTSFSRREEFRKPLPPPSSSPRGGYRGRVSSRGSLRTRLRERPTRRRLIESAYVLRRRAIRTNDYMRRVKMTKIRSGGMTRRPTKKSRSIDKDEDDEEESDEDKEVEVKKEKVDDDGEKKEGGEEDKEAASTPKKVKKEGSVEKDDKKTDSDGDEKPRRRPYIKLVCPHCQTKSATFARYTMHLQSGKHMSAMRRVAIKQKTILSRMRVIQRNAQRELEKTTEDLAPRTNFCPLCKLNYKQPKATHQASDAHKNMKKFLMPYCKICKITFKSPMLYESHCSSIDHLKRKTIAEEKSDKEDGSGLEDNLENFMTIDSVGEMEDEEGTEKKKDTAAAAAATDTTTADGEPSKPKEHINVGIENVKKVDVHYCDLCRMYLPRGEEAEIPKILAKHCKQRTHLQRYIRYKEDRELTKRAERLQRKETAEKEKEKVKEEPKSDDTEETKVEPKENGDVATNEEDGGEEKLWADVDKDLGDILAEAGSGNKSSDEDEEDSAANGERFDRFKLSEKEKKAEEKKLIAEDTEKGSVETEKETEPVAEK